MLPWLQRDYIRRVFPGYAPLTDHEDDRPYDVDHICPYVDWGDWVSVKKRFDAVDAGMQNRMRDGREITGDGIGNLRLVESSTNRHDQDDDIAVKMPPVVASGGMDAPISEMTDRLAEWTFPPEYRALWERVSRPGPVTARKWNNDRLEAFQQAVEQRAVWLYRCFHDDLDLAAWTSGQSQSNAPK